MQKLIAIALITVFALSQYAKQLSYIECKLSNTFKADTEKCDCEIKLSQSNTNIPDQPASNTHHHVHIDDVYFIEQPVTNDIVFAATTLNSRHLHHESIGFTQPPLQPPRS